MLTSTRSILALRTVHFHLFSGHPTPSSLLALSSIHPFSTTSTSLVNRSQNLFPIPGSLRPGQKPKKRNDWRKVEKRAKKLLDRNRDKPKDEGSSDATPNLERSSPGTRQDLRVDSFDFRDRPREIHSREWERNGENNWMEDFARKTTRPAFRPSHEGFRANPSFESSRGYGRSSRTVTRKDDNVPPSIPSSSSFGLSSLPQRRQPTSGLSHPFDYFSPSSTSSVSSSTDTKLGLPSTSTTWLDSTYDRLSLSPGEKIPEIRMLNPTTAEGRAKSRLRQSLKARRMYRKENWREKHPVTDLGFVEREDKVPFRSTEGSFERASTSGEKGGVQSEKLDGRRRERSGDPSISASSIRSRQSLPQNDFLKTDPAKRTQLPHVRFGGPAQQLRGMHTRVRIDHLKDSRGTSTRSRSGESQLLDETHIDARDAEFTRWDPKKRLSIPAMAGLRALHAQDPRAFNIPVLSEKFGISFEAVKRILRSKFREKQALQEPEGSLGADVESLGGNDAGWEIAGSAEPRRRESKGISKGFGVR